MKVKKHSTTIIVDIFENYGKIEVSIREVDFFGTQTECCTNASWSEFKYRNRDFCNYNYLCHL